MGEREPGKVGRTDSCMVTGLPTSLLLTLRMLLFIISPAPSSDGFEDSSEAVATVEYNITLVSARSPAFRFQKLAAGLEDEEGWERGGEVIGLLRGSLLTPLIAAVSGRGRM